MTNKDFEREYLQKEAESCRTTQIFSAISGLTTGTSSTLLLSTLDKLDPSSKTFGKIVGIIGIIVGGASFALSVLGGRWAKKAEDQIKQLDREQAIGATNTPLANNNPLAHTQHVVRY
jgi:hypothetical protein